MNKLQFTINSLAISTLLTACNHTGINPNTPDEIPAKQSPYALVHVYPERADIPKNSKILGKVTAQNKNLNGTKASSIEIMDELKRQAILLGGNGIVHVTPGTSQTTANAVLTY